MNRSARALLVVSLAQGLISTASANYRTDEARALVAEPRRDRQRPWYRDLAPSLVDSRGRTRVGVRAHPAAARAAPRRGERRLLAVWPDVERQLGSGITVDGHRPDERLNASWNRVSPGYFETVGTPLLRGRAINDGDGPAAPLVAVVSRSFAQKRFGDAIPSDAASGSDRIPPRAGWRSWASSATPRTRTER